jgi:hypothetical protein
MGGHTTNPVTSKASTGPACRLRSGFASRSPGVTDRRTLARATAGRRQMIFNMIILTVNHDAGLRAWAELSEI